jgi:hypothetical protein
MHMQLFLESFLSTQYLLLYIQVGKVAENCSQATDLKVKLQPLGRIAAANSQLCHVSKHKYQFNALIVSSLVYNDEG